MTTDRTPTRAKPARARARAFLESLVARAGGKRTRLPGLHALARSAGVSYETMRAAVRECASGGIVEAIAGSGVYAVGREETPVVAARPPKVLSVRDRLRNDIRQGLLEPGRALPQLKRLQHTYGVSYRPLREALLRLIDEGEVERFGRGYRVRPRPHHRFASSVVLILRGGRTGEVRFPGPRMQQDLWFLEHECAARGITLHVVSYRPVSEVFTFQSGDRTVLDRSSSSPVLGYLVWTTALSRSSLSRAFARLAPLGRPVAVLSEGHLLRPEDLPNALFRLYDMPLGRRAGAQVGRFLRGLGHRRVAYLARTPMHSFAEARLEGLREAFTGPRSSHTVDMCPLAAGRTLSGQDIRTEDLAAAAARSDLPDRAREILQLLLRNNVDAVPKLVLESNLDDAVHQALAAVLRTSSHTAWVCENDRLALAALRFLDERQVRVPSRLSVIGFDNSAEAHLHGLSSYDFGNLVYVRAMLDWVLSSSRRLPGAQPPPPEIFEGAVVPRRTTAKAREA